MPTESHDLYCQHPCCGAKRQAWAERRLLASMNFQQRKAWRVRKSRPTPEQPDE